MRVAEYVRGDECAVVLPVGADYVVVVGKRGAARSTFRILKTFCHTATATGRSAVFTDEDLAHDVAMLWQKGRYA